MKNRDKEIGTSRRARARRRENTKQRLINNGTDQRGRRGREREGPDLGGGGGDRSAREPEIQIRGLEEKRQGGENESSPV